MNQVQTRLTETSEGGDGLKKILVVLLTAIPKGLIDLVALLGFLPEVLLLANVAFLKAVGRYPKLEDEAEAYQTARQALERGIVYLLFGVVIILLVVK